MNLKQWYRKLDGLPLEDPEDYSNVEGFDYEYCCRVLEGRNVSLSEAFTWRTTMTEEDYEYTRSMILHFDREEVA